MRILITGASGFVGSWVCSLLQGRDYEIVGFDQNISPELPVATWHHGDICDLAALTAAAQGCQAILHLAVLPQYQSFDDPVSDLQVNGLGTLQALRAAVAAGVERFLLTSSSVVYGAGSGRLDESRPLQPISPYGVSKATAENYTGLFQRTTPLHTTIVRLFHLYGLTHEGALRQTVEGHFIKSVLDGAAPTIYGNPERAYDFVHIEDVVKAIVLALEAEVPSGLVLNVGSGRATSLQQLADWCMQAAGIVYTPTLIPGPTARRSQYADLTQTQRYLDYEPEHDLQEWVFKTVRHFRQT